MKRKTFCAYMAYMSLMVIMAGLTARNIDRYIKNYKDKDSWLYLVPASLGAAGVLTGLDIIR